MSTTPPIPTFPNGWQQATRYPDPAIVALDPRFEKYWLKPSCVERLATGTRWGEGPVWFGDGRYLLWSDIPNNRILKWEEETGAVGVFRKPSDFANGNTRDRQGRLVTCLHGGRSVIRTEYDGSITTLIDSFDGKRLNSPNDVVVKSDGSIWFTDPVFGILGDYEGYKSEPEIDANVYRLEPGTHEPSIVAEGVLGPNGLCFSPDERRLYVTDSGGDLSTSLEAQSDPAGGSIPEPHHVRVFEVVGGRTLANGYQFVDMAPGVPDGVRVDAEGHLWAAAIDGVRVYAPDGAHLGTIHVPEVTANLCFGGLERDTLFIAATTSLYRVRVNRRGL